MKTNFLALSISLVIIGLGFFSCKKETIITNTVYDTVTLPGIITPADTIRDTILGPSIEDTLTVIDTLETHDTLLAFYPQAGSIIVEDGFTYIIQSDFSAIVMAVNPDIALKQGTLTIPTIIKGGFIQINDRVYQLYGGNSITAVNSKLLANNSSLISLEMPSILTVGNEAFSGCTSLTNVASSSVLTLGNRAFSGCTSLNVVAMPALTTIGDMAFLECKSLNMGLLSSLENIGDIAFLRCEKLSLNNKAIFTDATGIMYTKTANGEAKVLNYTKESVGSVTIPSSVTINNTAYTVTTIGRMAFWRCSSLVSITMPSVTRIEEAAFYESSLTTLITKATDIAKSAFKECKDLTSVTLSKVTTVNSSTFYNCNYLTFVSLPEATIIGDSAFYVINSSEYSQLETINIPKVKTIGKFAFASCAKLKKAIMPEVTFIGSRAFSYCDALTEVSMPKIEEVKVESFAKNLNLTTVYLGAKTSFKYIGTDEVFEIHPALGMSAVGSFNGSKWTPEKNSITNENVNIP